MAYIILNGTNYRTAETLDDVKHIVETLFKDSYPEEYDGIEIYEIRKIEYHLSIAFKPHPKAASEFDLGSGGVVE